MDAHFLARVKLRDVAPKDYFHTSLAMIGGLFISYWLAPKLGYVTDINAISVFFVILLTAGVTWFFDYFGVSRIIPEKWEYIPICATAGALYNMLVTGVNVMPYSFGILVSTIIPEIYDPGAVLRGAIIGALMGFVAAVLVGGLGKKEVILKPEK